MSPTAPRPAALPASAPGAALDPRTLGRPVHLLPRFTQQLGEALAGLFRAQRRRHRAHYQLGALQLSPGLAGLPSDRWLSAQGELGQLACRIERGLLLRLMAQRYGETESSEGPPAETATEERLQLQLGRQLIEVLLQTLGMPAELPLHAGPLGPVGPGSWLLRIPVHDEGFQSELLIALEAPWIDRLLRDLSAQMPARRAPAGPEGEPLARRLKLKLEARLLEKTLSLGELLDLRPGDVLPARLQTADVRVDGSRLFTAAVAEHQGKLCLTAFADAN